MSNQYEGSPIPKQVMPGIKMNVSEMDYIDHLRNMHYRSDAEGQLYLQAQVQGRVKWMPITSRVVHAHLSNVISQHWGKYISVQKVREYLENVSITVTPQGPPLVHFNRIGSSDGAIVLDLHDPAGNAVFITPGGWEVRQNQEVLFKEYKHQLPLPVPVPGNGMDEFFDLHNIHDVHQRALLGAWLVACFFTENPRAHLIFVGKAGSGKSTISLAVKNLIDPCELRDMVQKNLLDMVQMVDHNAIPLIDNMKKITDEISAMLCVAYTGGKITTRVKFTTDEDHHFNLKKGVIITAESLRPYAADLVDRMIMIPMSKQHDRVAGEAGVNEAYHEMRPRIMGTILTAVSHVMGRLPGFNPTGLVRTADYHRIGLLAAEVLGYGSQVFDEAIRLNVVQKADSKRRSNPVVNALVKLMEGQVSLQTYMNELAPQLKAVVDDPNEIPSQPNQLSRVLSNSEPLLREHGISIKSYSNDSYGKPYVITNEKAYENELTEIIDESTGVVYTLD